MAKSAVKHVAMNELVECLMHARNFVEHPGLRDITVKHKFAERWRTIVSKDLKKMLLKYKDYRPTAD